LPLRRREQTRAPCRATTSLSRLSCLPKRWPLACENLPLRRLTPAEVVWHPGDPPRIIARELQVPGRRRGLGAKIADRRRSQYARAKFLQFSKSPLANFI